MAIWVGTSGYNYTEWRGSFYPEKFPTTKMLPYYAERFDTVEINNTFYRMPAESAAQGWNDATPARFKLTLKAPQKITHFARLKDCGEPVARFLEVAETLGDKLGILLFQLPPNFKRDLPRLQAFLALFPDRVRVAFEFRNPSWIEPDTLQVLREHNVALCIADTEDSHTPLEITAKHAYFRLRDEGYTPADIERWAKTLRERTAVCDDVFVYFKHEDEGKGPEFAKQLLAALR